MVTLIDDEKAFSVAVTDEAPQGQREEQGTLADLAASAAESTDPDQELVIPEVGLAVITGLVDDVEVAPGRDRGVVVTMSWPISV